MMQTHASLARLYLILFLSGFVGLGYEMVWIRMLTGGLGRAVGFNTLGAAFAPAITGVVILPRLGLKFALLGCALGYLFTIPKLLFRSVRHLAIILLIALSIICRGNDLRLLSLPRHSKILAHIEGVMSNVTVYRDPDNETHLAVDNHYQMGGTTSVFTDRRQAHIPLLLHHHPRRVLFLGVGTGGTFAAVRDYPEITAIGVELVPEIVPLIGYFMKSTGNLDALERSRITRF